ncbi:MAG TPA: PilZ domain-containing protein [Dissulfurispiraceae bacterium]|nr:PilZ domain-containing protein [Dissulfurispiraceae bacterium]
MHFLDHEKFQKLEDIYDEERFWPRFKCKLATQIFDEAGASWDCDIIDISESGFGIMTGAKLKRGKTVNISASPIMKASVVWVRNNKAGLVIAE